MELLLGEILTRNRQVNPARIAVALDDEALSFAEVDDAANRWANALRGVGVRYQDNVVWWSDMTLREVEGYWALARLGATFAPINPSFSADEARPLIEYLHPTVLVADDAHAERAADLCAELGITLAVFGGGDRRVPGRDLDAAVRSASASFATDPALVERDPHGIFLTSGSTGVPKGVVLSHRTSWLRASWMAQNLALPSGRTAAAVIMFPLFHWAAWSNLMQHWQAHSAVYFVRGAKPELLIQAVERRRASMLYCIPGVWRRIFASGCLDTFDTSSLEYVGSGTSAVSMELLSELKQRFPGTISGIGYGSTEGGPGAHLKDHELFAKPGSVGRPDPYTQVRLAGDGEICVRSAALADGYFERPDATAEAFVDGWYHTGDLGSFDDEGYLWVIGRTREVIRSGGEWVVPAELEEALHDVPGIKDLAVLGMPDEHWGEVVSAVLVMDDGRPCPTVDELRAHLAGVATYKHPRRLFTLDEIPRTPATGQVRRAFLKEHLLERLEDPSFSCTTSRPAR